MRALLLTHGDLGDALKRSASDLYPDADTLECLSNEGLSARSLRARVAEWLARDESPALLLVDVAGGSCGVAARAAARGRSRTWVLGGVNLAMVLTYLASHGDLEAEELVAKILDRALNAITLLDTDI